METRGKKDIAKNVAAKLGITTTLAESVLTGTLDYIKNEVAAGNRVTVQNFGRFEKRHYAARKCTLPGYENTMVDAFDVIAFKPAAHI